MTIYYNGEAVLQYDRNKPLTGQQTDSLERMDDKMALGIMLGSEFVIDPDPLQRARFVASQLGQALQSDNEQVIAATCAWLAVRVPELKQVRMTDEADGLMIDLVVDESRANQVPVSLEMPEAAGKPS
ncbi:MAG: hypothetical protein PVF75_06710 [Granulosicoccaceae bacterium]